jgi:hypothetical protein
MDYISKIDQDEIDLEQGFSSVMDWFLLRYKGKIQPYLENYDDRIIRSKKIPTTFEILKFIANTENARLKNKNWLLDYIDGNYNMNDRYNIPLDVQEYLNKYGMYHGNECFKTEFKLTKNLTLYRGMSFHTYKELTNWSNDEIMNMDEDFIGLKTNKYTSWTSEDEMDDFSINTFGIVFSCTFIPSEYDKFWNLIYLNEYECEFLMKPGTFQCKVEDIIKDYKPAKLSDWKLKNRFFFRN